MATKKKKAAAKEKEPDVAVEALQVVDDEVRERLTRIHDSARALVMSSKEGLELADRVDETGVIIKRLSDELRTARETNNTARVVTASAELDAARKLYDERHATLLTRVDEIETAADAIDGVLGE